MVATVGISSRPLSERVNHKELVKELAFVDGKFTEGHKKMSFSVVDPGSGVDLGSVPDMDAADASAAVAAASDAWSAWRELLAKEKQQVLARWHALVQTHAQDLAVIIASESGKPLREAQGEVAYAASFISLYAEQATRVCGTTVPSGSASTRLLTIKQPVGPCALITPWNFPLAMITRKAAPALAAGCPVVIKPSELTPFSALALAVLAEEAGVPAGVFNVITSSRNKTAEVGDVLAGSELIRKLSFTGSTAVGKHLMQRCASTVKRISLELGGCAPFVVFEDADLEVAAREAVAAKFRNSGQTCVCPNRFLVQDSVYDEFSRKLAERVERLKVGHGLEPESTCGPLINEAGLNKVREQVAEAVREGASVLVGGHARERNFFDPTVLTNVKPSMRCFREETFGPLAPICKFSSEADALALANDSSSGLAAYIFTRDLGRAWRVSEAIEAGLVGVNEGVISTATMPFGGVKESGLGREGSDIGIDEWRPCTLAPKPHRPSTQTRNTPDPTQTADPRP